MNPYFYIPFDKEIFEDKEQLEFLLSLDKEIMRNNGYNVVGYDLEEYVEGILF